MQMKKHTQDLIAEIPRRNSRVGTTIGIGLGDIWSHYCTLTKMVKLSTGSFPNQPVRRRQAVSGLGTCTDSHEAGTHSIWISKQIEELGHVRRRAEFGGEAMRMPLPKKRNKHIQRARVEAAKLASTQVTNWL
jgi:hypothetical protein